jgi:Methyltransferase domain
MIQPLSETSPKLSIGEHIDNYMSVNLAELRWLHETAKKMQSIVEIGSCKGRSTYALCSSGCPSVIAVDDFGCGTYDEFVKNTKEFIFKNLTLYKMLSREAASLITETDMVFIDGMHHYVAVIDDLKLWTPKAKKLICGHDWIDRDWSDVQKAVRDYFSSEPHEVFETIWVYWI